MVAWGIKGSYQGNRPITVIRKLADMAQKDPVFAQRLVAMAPDHLKMVTYTSEEPVSDGVKEVVKKTKLAIKAWRAPQFGAFYGTEAGPIELRDYTFRMSTATSAAEEAFYQEVGVSGVGWILAENWMPYQRQSFVTPPFPGFVSGHSTFSRAAAEVLAGVTGTEYFPGGLMTYPAPNLHFEASMEDPFEFQWATYYDASDVSGISRIYGGIHANYDDLPARKIGSQIGKAAVEKSKEIFGQ